eukprot:scaffold1385_cov403-Prasinococcus_capsulatus_cf.AAC.6
MANMLISTLLLLCSLAFQMLLGAAESVVVVAENLDQSVTSEVTAMSLGGGLFEVTWEMTFNTELTGFLIEFSFDETDLFNTPCNITAINYFSEEACLEFQPPPSDSGGLDLGTYVPADALTQCTDDGPICHGLAGNNENVFDFCSPSPNGVFDPCPDFHEPACAPDNENLILNSHTIFQIGVDW